MYFRSGPRIINGVGVPHMDGIELGDVFISGHAACAGILGTLSRRLSGPGQSSRGNSTFYLME